MEREERMNLYESLLNDKTQLVVEMGNEKQQLEIMTRMKNDVEMYGGVFNTTELDVISAIYDEVVQYSGFVVGCIPSWFATTETSWCDGESTHLEMNEEELLRQVAPWSGLRHPYVMKLYGACHVGRPFVIHESSCAERVDELPWKEVLSVALGLEYIQERGYRHQQTTLLRLSTDKKLVLSVTEQMKQM
ncbi:Serine/threonine protein kinase [Phytophthora palmivora]|uniref:Serine/threonine protein kinase n=1 Tax=Phytophthora palmivora TaxID=4796 RepID=A0A2P4XN48_9STRA|nr:Serine/threonine protein kinase [Phytophthora palmivora]